MEKSPNDSVEIPVREPGEIVEGKTFAEAFGLNFTEEGLARYLARLAAIDEAEHEAFILSRNVLLL